MLRKKSSEKSAKKKFYIHTNIVTNKRGGKRAKQIFRNTQIVRSKMFGKNRAKKGLKMFFIFIRISLQKNAWKKTCETNFSETHE